MKNKKLDVIVDLQFGSTGKGAIAGFLSTINEYEAAVSVNMPNAGHTAYSPAGVKFIHKVLPSGIFSPKLEAIGIGPGAIFDIDRLAAELRGIEEFGLDVDILIHETAGILKPEHKDVEKATLSRISSTMQGSAAALVDKILRIPDAIVGWPALGLIDRLTAAGVKSRVMILNQREWLDRFSSFDNILLEGSQGYSLGISSGFYPYCTSRDCTPARVIADASFPVAWLKDVYGSARTFPIRVGNTPDGYSGDWYPDQKEISFESLEVEPELTTVTNRVRRIATFSIFQMEEAMAMAMPSHVFLNFCNYHTNEEDVEKVVLSINSIAKNLGCGGVGFTGWGPKPKDITDIRGPKALSKEDKTKLASMTKEVVDWADKLLPNRDPVNTCIKLTEEVSELTHAIYTGDGDVGEEVADVLVLLLDIGCLMGVDVPAEFYRKMIINKARRWETKNGSLKHTKDQ